MKKVKLNFAERIHLIGFLPTQGSFLVINLVEELKKECALSKEEVEEYDVKLDRSSGSYSWKPNNVLKDIEICNIVLDEIEIKIKQFDTEKKLNAVHIPLIEKLVDIKKFFEKEKK